MDSSRFSDESMSAYNFGYGGECVRAQPLLVYRLALSPQPPRNQQRPALRRFSTSHRFPLLVLRIILRYLITGTHLAKQSRPSRHRRMNSICVPSASITKYPSLEPTYNILCNVHMDRHDLQRRIMSRHNQPDIILHAIDPRSLRQPNCILARQRVSRMDSKYGQRRMNLIQHCFFVLHPPTQLALNYFGQLKILLKSISHC